MKEFVLLGVAGCFLGFAIASFMLGDVPLGLLGILCAIGFYVTRRVAERSGK